MTRENREFNRYIFPTEANIRVSLVLQNGGGVVQARILNISKGGMGLALERNNVEEVKQNVELRLENVTGDKDFTDLHGKVLKVIWVLNDYSLSSVGIGCAFVNLGEKGQVQINNLLED